MATVWLLAGADLHNDTVGAGVEAGDGEVFGGQVAVAVGAEVAGAADAGAADGDFLNLGVHRHTRNGQADFVAGLAFAGVDLDGGGGNFEAGRIDDEGVLVFLVGGFHLLGRGDGDPAADPVFHGEAAGDIRHYRVGTAFHFDHDIAEVVGAAVQVVHGPVGAGDGQVSRGPRTSGVMVILGSLMEMVAVP